VRRRDRAGGGERSGGRGRIALRCGAGLVAVLLCAGLANCMFYKTEVGVVSEDVARTPREFTVESPAKLHLRDGGVVLYDDGFKVRGETILGHGERYDLTRSTRTPVASLPAGEVLYIEYYDRKNQHRMISEVTTAAASYAAGVGTLNLLKAIFGSCPTVYSADGDARRLEAELFSHSISRAWEMSDLDRLESLSQRDGIASVDLANEALETHYIDALKLRVVDHGAGFEAFPLGNGDVALTGAPAVPLQARNSIGNDVLDSIARRDEKQYQSGERMLRAFTANAKRDWIDLAVTVPRSAESMYVLLRLRNTLLATVFLYDVAMAEQGYAAIDWMATDSGEAAYASRFSRWFNDGFGIALEVPAGDSYRRVAQLPPTGPIAWKQVAMKVSAPRPGVARLRLSFTPDNWSIDWVGVSFATSDAMHSRVLDPQALTVRRGNGYAHDPSLLAGEDGRYLVTYPGDLYRVSYALPPVPAGMERSYFLASRGYYVEWMRMDWIAGRDAGEAPPMEFDDALLQRTARTWLQKRGDLEARFYGTRLPLEGGMAQ